MKIALAQINPTVGDISGNVEKIISFYQAAQNQGADLVVFPELAVCGYLVRDLLLKKHFITEIKEKILPIISLTKGSKTAILLGSPVYEIYRQQENLFNSALLIDDGQLLEVVHKKTLPNYGVFDEKRYFKASDYISTIEFRDQTLAILVCEDLWDQKNLFLLSEKICDVVISINASPYSKTKPEKRFEVAKKFSQTLKKPLIYVNQVGGQDEIVFDGNSFALNVSGEKVLELKSFEEDLAFVEVKKSGEIKAFAEEKNYQLLSEQEKIGRDYSACVLALRDYVRKTGFAKVLLGMSGGIDSALVAAISVDALGSENVRLVALPSRFNSQQSMQDALKCCENLAVKLEVISIEEAFKATLASVGEISSLATENLQSRIRGNILMALSNSSNVLLISTGNKSEMSTGYATLYGDMNGAFNPIKDLYKTDVYALANWRNKNVPKISLHQKLDVIAQNVISKAPTAELRENQKDSDSLPEYDILDKILFALIEEAKSVEEIIAQGFEADLVKKIVKLFYNSEFKRRQSCLGAKISDMSFDQERRYCVTNKFYK